MRILIAEDDVVSRSVLQTKLVKWGYDVVNCCDGREAISVLRQEDAPQMALIDWMMPEMDGTEICRAVRATPRLQSLYLILVTARTAKEDIVSGLASGADDYVTKPYDSAELRARLQVGCRILDLQARLSERVQELEQSIAQIKRLQGLLPICSYCKNVRNDQNYWQAVEGYISDHSNARFSHGVCPTCWDRIVAPELAGATRPEVAPST